MLPFLFSKSRTSHLLPRLKIKQIFNKNFHKSHELRNPVSQSRNEDIKTNFRHSRSARLWILLLPFTAFGLGTWQIFRLKEKERMISQRKQLMEAPQVELPTDLSGIDVSSLELRKVHTEGCYLNSNQTFLGPRFYNDQVGYHIITPFLTRQGVKILVDRGWIPSNMKKTFSILEIESKGKEESIVGYLIRNGKHNRFVPGYDRKRNQWFAMDVPAIAHEMGTLPILIDLSESSPKGQYPITGLNSYDLRNDHLQYIFTWYSLGTLLSVMSWIFIRAPLKP